MSIIEVSELRKRYGDTVAVADVSLRIEEGEIFGILGPNGAGKTTTVECIAGLRTPDGGTVRVAGLDPHDAADVKPLRQILGLQLQESELPEKLKVGEAMQLYSTFYEHPADTDELVRTLGLEAKLSTRFGKLSGGQKQRLSIALALIGRPRVAILDELTTGLDPQARRDTWALIEQIREQGVTVLLVTHFMEEAERLCDRVAVIDGGRVVALDTPTRLTEATTTRQLLRFVPSAPIPEGMLTALAEVDSVTARGEQLEVGGHGDVLGAVISTLSSHGIVAQHLRVDQGSLEDAFVALTGGNHHES